MVINGTSGNDRLIGTPDSDIFVGFAGNDSIDGGAGTDIAVYGANASTYSIARLANGDIIVIDSTGIEGTDTLHSVEVVQFKDKAMFNLQGEDATLARLYSAALGRAPDPVGLAWQLDHGLHAGLTIMQIINNFLGSTEYAQRFGGLGNAAFIDALYQNVLGRAGDAGGRAVQIAAIDGGLAREQLVLNFADSPENRLKVLGDWLLG